LREVGAISRGSFKPSALGGYERGERSLSLERFCQLATIYGVTGDQLLADLLELREPDGRKELVIDLNRLVLVEEPVRRPVAEFVHEVRARRGDYVTDIVTLRSVDLHSLALATRAKPETLLEKLGPAIRHPAGPPQPPRRGS